MKKAILAVILAAVMMQPCCQKDKIETVNLGRCTGVNMQDYCGDYFEYINNSRCTGDYLQVACKNPSQDVYWYCEDDCWSLCSQNGLTYSGMCGYVGPGGTYNEFQDCWCDLDF